MRGVARVRVLLTGLAVAGLLFPFPACSSRSSSSAATSETPVSPLELPPGASEALAAITAGELRATVAELSSASYEGRAPGTEGDRRTRAYLEERLRALGLEPGAPGERWQQPFPLVGVTARMPERWTFRTPAGREASFAWWDELIAASGVQRERVDVREAEVVFCGYGIEAPEQDWDDLKDADLEGKVLLLLNDDPDWSPELFGGKRRLYYGRWTYKYESAARQGAAGAFIVHTRASAGYPWKVVQTSWSGEQTALPAGDEPRTPVHGWLTEDAARRLCALGGRKLDRLTERARSRDFAPVPLGVTLDASFTCDLRRRETANVAGLLRGTDPESSQELVVFTAHHDHLGRGEPDATGDRLYNGARDNAAGVARALAVAEAFRRLPAAPRRSVLFLFVGAEEQGLLGSKRFARHPTVPAGRLAANINFELGNIWGRTRDVVVHGGGKTDLEDLLAAAASRQGRRVAPEPDPGQGWYYRSDQFSFARIGVPALWFQSGTDYVGRPENWGTQQVERWNDEHYHQPSDELTPEWDFDGMVENARLAFLVGLAAASREALPAWRAGDEFADERERALEALEEGAGR